ncbi:MAG: hypothetical protein ACREYE_33160 [Gammaproteobacteria bacterium]
MAAPRDVGYRGCPTRDLRGVEAGGANTTRIEFLVAVSRFALGGGAEQFGGQGAHDPVSVSTLFDGALCTIIEEPRVSSNDFSALHGQEDAHRFGQYQSQALRVLAALAALTLPPPWASSLYAEQKNMLLSNRLRTVIEGLVVMLI